MPDITFVIPYRDREEHLALFVPHLHNHLQYFDFSYKVVVVEQEQGKPFNRAKLLNIGALCEPAACYVFHDVDMLPVEVNYLPCKSIAQLAGSTVQRNGYLGGVTMFRHMAFIESGGYHNDYFSRAEDNEMRFNLRRLGMAVEERHGAFQLQEHERGVLFDRVLWAKAQLPRIIQDQLTNCNYAVLSDTKKTGYRHIQVSI